MSSIYYSPYYRNPTYPVLERIDIEVSPKGFLDTCSKKLLLLLDQNHPTNDILELLQIVQSESRKNSQDCSPQLAFFIFKCFEKNEAGLIQWATSFLQEFRGYLSLCMIYHGEHEPLFSALMAFDQASVIWEDPEYLKRIDSTSWPYRFLKPRFDTHEDHFLPLIRHSKGVNRDIFKELIKRDDLARAQKLFGENEFPPDFYHELLWECVEKNALPFLEILAKCWEEKPHLKPDSHSMIDGFLPIHWAYFKNNHEMVDRLYELFGIEQLTPLFETQLFQLIGLRERDKELLFAYLSQLDYPQKIALQRNFLRFLSEQFEEVIEGLDHQPIETIRERIAEKKNTNPVIADSPIDFTAKQLELFEAMQSFEKLRHFPFSKLWQLGIDGWHHEWGCAIYESEPGYLRAFFHGMTWALKNCESKLSVDWLVSLHAALVWKNYHVRSDRNVWDLRPNYHEQSIEFRSREIGFSLRNRDRDPIGMGELDAQGLIGVDMAKQYCLLICPAQEFPELHLDNLIKRFDLYLQKSDTSPAKRLMAYFWFARKIEITHYFRDGNTRTAIVTLSALCLKDPDLHFPHFFDPNILDGNSPESVAFRYIEACLNFASHGRTKMRDLKNGVKKLSELVMPEDIGDLPSGREIADLLEELKSLNLENLSWSDLENNLLN